MADPVGIAERQPTRVSGVSRREWWGYLVWGFVGVVITVSELWAVFGKPPWPTISSTVAHLEQLWSPVKIIVVAVIVAAAVQLITYPPRRDEFRPEHAPPRWRTDKGRLTKTEAGQTVEIEHAELYFPIALIVVVAAAAVTAAAGYGKFVVGYVLYGSIAVTLVIIPDALAFWFAKEVPYPTLFRTLDNLDNRWHPAILIIWAGLAVLAIHLVAFPWP